VSRVARALQREDGMTLVEVLIVSILMLIVLVSTLETFNQFERK
jgi:prepilin-type N-terminal cleavage/methylation domain-containing protein